MCLCVCSIHVGRADIFNILYSKKIGFSFYLCVRALVSFGFTVFSAFLSSHRIFDPSREASSLVRTGQMRESQSPTASEGAREKLNSHSSGGDRYIVRFCGSCRRSAFASEEHVSVFKAMISASGRCVLLAAGRRSFCRAKNASKYCDGSTARS